MIRIVPTAVRRLVLVLVASLAGSLGLTLAVPGPAHAVFPTRHTTYDATVVRADGLAARIRIKIRGDKKTVAKVKVEAACADGTTLKIVRRDLPIHRTGGFSVEKLTKRGKVVYSVSGAWESREVAFGEVDLLRCPPGGFAYLAER